MLLLHIGQPMVSRKLALLARKGLRNSWWHLSLSQWLEHMTDSLWAVSKDSRKTSRYWVILSWFCKCERLFYRWCEDSPDSCSVSCRDREKFCGLNWISQKKKKNWVDRGKKLHFPLFSFLKFYLVYLLVQEHHLTNGRSTMHIISGDYI